MLNISTPKPATGRISLKQRVMNAGVWSLAGYGLSQAMRFGTNLLMTRLLVPEMFGVMAVATMIMVGLEMFSDVGLKQSAIQSKRGSDPDFLNTAWTIQILRGAALWCFALCVALLVFFVARNGMVSRDSVYADQDLPHVIAILSFTALIMGFQSTKMFEASRNLSLGRVTTVGIVSQIAGLLCTIGWVLIDRSIWGLVAGNICSALVWTLFSHLSLSGAANRWKLDRSASREIIHFGKWIFVASILGFLVNSGDRLLLSGLVSVSVLGVYVIAFSIFSSVEQVLTKIIGDVSFPALSEVVRERPHDLKQSYYRFHTVIASFAYFCSGILMISGQSLIGLLYDRRYEQAGWMLEVLAAALLTIPFRVAAICLLALGLSRLHSHIILVRVVFLFLLTPLGFHLFDLPGALVGIVASYFSVLPITIFYQIKYDLLDLRKELLMLTAVPVGLLLGEGFKLAVMH